MNVSKALQVIQTHPKGPLVLTCTSGIDNPSDDSVDASITPFGDPMELMASYHGNGSVEEAIIEMAETIKVKRPLVLNYICSCNRPSSVCMVHGCVG